MLLKVYSALDGKNISNVMVITIGSNRIVIASIN